MHPFSYQAAILFRMSTVLVFGLLVLQACKPAQDTATDSKTTPQTSQTKTTEQALPAKKPSTQQATPPAVITPQNASSHPANLTASIASQVQCKKGTLDLTREIFTIAKSLEGFDYTQTPPSALQDCSGMFHRVVQSFSESCPGYALPNPKEHRQSIAIGKWYADKNLFTVITDPLRQAHLIQEGTVLFYGHQKKRYSAQELGSPHEAIKKINHLGVVVKTEQRDGVVIQYQLFHGRRPGQKSAITAYHYRQPRSTPDFPYGNGAEQLIGLAPFVSGTPAL
jgi:hypothetical protein